MVCFKNSDRIHKILNRFKNDKLDKCKHKTEQLKGFHVGIRILQKDLSEN